MNSLTSEMAAALKAHEDVFFYWRKIRRGPLLPARRDLDPCALKQRLPTISLIDVIKPSDEPGADNHLLGTHRFRQRLAGTELFAAYGTEITGRFLDQIYQGAEMEQWHADLSLIVETKKPNVGLQSMAWAGARGLYLFWLRMPLATDGVHVDMILGHDVLIGRPDIGSQSGIRAA